MEITHMNIKLKIINTIVSHHKIAIFGIGLAIIFSIGLTSGVMEGPQLAHAGFILGE